MSLPTCAGEMETYLAFVLSPRSPMRLRIYLAALFSLPTAPQSHAWLRAQDACSQFFEGEVEMPGSTRSGSSGPARMTIGQPAFSNSCQTGFYGYENQKEPGKVSGGIWVFGGYWTSVS